MMMSKAMRNLPRKMSTTTKTCIVIAGATCTGKTAAAIDVAKFFNAEIISADSRQCYRELNIGVARPSPEELAALPHHFIADRSIHEPFNAADYENYSHRTLQSLFEKSDFAVVAGGTGLYIKAMMEGMDNIPAVPQELRNKIINDYQTHGIDWLRNELHTHDQDFFAKGEMKNPQRMMRALEVKLFTGNSILTYFSHTKNELPWKFFGIHLQKEREQLKADIDLRVDKMMEMGLLNEVKGLVTYQSLNALQTVGYRELFSYLNNEIDLADAVDLIKKNTRQYAKRQITWFKRLAFQQAYKENCLEVVKTSLRK